MLALVRGVLSADRDAEEAATALDAYALSSLMRTVAGQHAGGPLMEADFAEAADLARAAKMLQGDVTFSTTAARIEGQVNLACRRFDHVEQMLAEDDLSDDTAWLLSTELAHPANGLPGASHYAWLKLFNRRFEQFGMLPITLAEGPGEPFDRVTSTSERAQNPGRSACHRDHVHVQAGPEFPHGGAITDRSDMAEPRDPGDRRLLGDLFFLILL